jgi:hypothetical protein
MLSGLTSLAKLYNQNSIQSHSKSIFDCLLDCYCVYFCADATWLEHIMLTRNIEALPFTVKVKIREFFNSKVVSILYNFLGIYSSNIEYILDTCQILF